MNQIGARDGDGFDSHGLVPVLDTFDETLLAVIRSVLEEHQIPFVIRGHGAAGLDSLVRRVAGLFSQRAAGIRVLVPADRAEEAAALLTPVEGSFQDVPELADSDEGQD